MGTLMCSWSVRNSGLTMDLGLLWGGGVLTCVELSP